MSKVILVIDMPESCNECLLCVEWKPNRYFCSGFPNNGIDIEDEKIRPDWCPLKTVPEKKKEKTLNDIVGVGDRESVFKCVLEELVKQGYNACIDEILKEGAE